MSVDIQSIKAGLRARAAETVKSVAADRDVAPADVENALLVLGGDFDRELDRERKRLKLAALQAELTPLIALRDEEAAKSKIFDDEYRATQVRHAGELRDVEARCREQGRLTNMAAGNAERKGREIGKLETEIGGQP